MEYCEKYTALISAAIDGELTPQERGELMEHLAQCPACREIYGQMMAMSQAFDDWDVEVPGDLAGDVMRKIRAEVPAKKSSRRRWVQLGAAAACCALVIFGYQNLRPHGVDTSSPTDDASAADSTPYSVVADSGEMVSDRIVPEEPAAPPEISDEQILENVLTHFRSTPKVSMQEAGLPQDGAALPVLTVSSSAPELANWMAEHVTAEGYTEPDSVATAWLISREEYGTLAEYLDASGVDYTAAGEIPEEQLEDTAQGGDAAGQVAPETVQVCVIYFQETADTVEP